MRRRPLAISIYGFALLLIAMSMPIQACWQIDAKFWQVSAWITQFTQLNLFVFASMIASAYFTFKKPHGLVFLVPVTVFLVFFNNYWVGHVGLNFSNLQAWTGSFLFLGINLVLLEPRALEAILNPSAQWWRSAQRKQLRIPVVVHPWVGDSIAAVTHDLSTSGAFLTCSNDKILNVGDRMQLRMSLSGYKDIRCTARLVRKSEGAGSYPAGFGIHFEDLNRAQRQFLENALGSVG